MLCLFGWCFKIGFFPFKSTSIIRYYFQGALNSFEMKKLDCVFDEKYFNQNDSECVMKEEDGRNKFAGGHGELATAIDEDVVSTCYTVKRWRCLHIIM